MPIVISIIYKFSIHGHFVFHFQPLFINPDEKLIKTTPPTGITLLVDYQTKHHLSITSILLLTVLGFKKILNLSIEESWIAKCMSAAVDSWCHFKTLMQRWKLCLVLLISPSQLLIFWWFWGYYTNDVFFLLRNSCACNCFPGFCR